MTMATAPAIARENARRPDGQFGTQAHSAPEMSLAGQRPPVDTAYDALVTAAREGKLARVNAAAAHMPEHIRGVRFIRQGPDAVPALFHPATPGGHVAGVGAYKEQHLYPVTAYVTVAPDVLELEEIEENSGNPAWDWIPTPEQRALPALFADTAATEASRRFQAATDEFRDVAAMYLRTQMPDGVDSIVVAYGPELRDGAHTSVVMPVGAYDANGALVPLDPQTPANAHYWETVKRLGDPGGRFPRAVNDAGGIEYTIQRTDRA